MIKIIKTYQIFPAYAGLNLCAKLDMKSSANIPRIRGVEPEKDVRLK